MLFLFKTQTKKIILRTVVEIFEYKEFYGKYNFVPGKPFQFLMWAVPFVK